MATLIDTKPLFGPQADESATVILPAIPVGLTAELEAAIHKYRTAFFSRDVDGDAVAEQSRSAAIQIAGMPLTSSADIAAKLIIGLHESHPTWVGDQLALDARSFETDASGRILLSVVDDLLTLAASPSETGEWQALAVAQHAAHTDTMERGIDEAELSRRCDVEDEIVYRLLDVPAPSMDAFVDKLRIVFGWSFSPARDVLDRLLLDGQRLISRSAAGPTLFPQDARWAPRLEAYLGAKSAEDAYDRDVFMPAFEACQDGGPSIPDEIDNEISRLAELRYAAEDALMEIEAADGAALAIKFLIAHGDGRAMDGWDHVIEADARRLAGLETKPVSTDPRKS